MMLMTSCSGCQQDMLKVLSCGRFYHELGVFWVLMVVVGLPDIIA